MKDEILVPLDGSPLAEAILPHAVMLARTTARSITLLRAVASPMNGGAAALWTPTYTCPTCNHGRLRLTRPPGICTRSRGAYAIGVPQ